MLPIGSPKTYTSPKPKSLKDLPQVTTKLGLILEILIFFLIFVGAGPFHIKGNVCNLLQAICSTPGLTTKALNFSSLRFLTPEI